MSIIFKQFRSGKDGQVFVIYKIRTMIDHKPTKFGKILRATKLDELPQILNIIRGEMSLVGPRPLTLEEHKQFRNYNLPVKPGITGLWQLWGCDKSIINSLDSYYYTRKCWWYDLAILLATIPILVWRGIKKGR